MKIKYKKIIRSTDYQPVNLTRKIVEELHKQGYEILQQSQNSIEFKYNIWSLGSRTDAFKKIDGGKFDIFSVNKSIVLSYYLSPIFEILASCVAAFFGFTQDYHIFYFIIFIAIMLIIRLISVKIVANRMIENIVAPKDTEV